VSESHQKYFGVFSDRESVAREFDEGRGSRFDASFVIAETFPTDDQILFAVYDCPPYEGVAFVVFERDGILYEVHGSHCSCWGLEDQWEPEETSRAALAIRRLDQFADEPEAVARFAELFQERH
jgi:hypothetical protein